MFVWEYLKKTSLATVCILFGMYLLAALDPDFTAALRFRSFALIFVFAAVITAANYILNIEKINVFLRRTIHYFALLVSFLALFIIAGNIAFSGAKILIAAVIFSLAYLVVSLLIFAVAKLMKKTASPAPKTEEYRSRFR